MIGLVVVERAAVHAVLVEPPAHTVPVHTESRGGSRNVAALEAQGFRDLVSRHRGRLGRRRPPLLPQRDPCSRIEVSRAERLLLNGERVQGRAANLAGQLADVARPRTQAARFDERAVDPQLRGDLPER